MTVGNCPHLEGLARLLLGRAGFREQPERWADCQQRLSRVLWQHGLRKPSEYLARVAADPGLFDALLDEVLIGETYFFRDPGHFEFIAREVLPPLAGGRGPDQPFRAWSAGCASGEEAFSLAVVLDQEGWAGRAHVLATDLSVKALAKAHRGIYTRWSVRQEGEAQIRPYLRPAGPERPRDFCLAEGLHRAVTFRRLNLATDPYPSVVNGTYAQDLILCRNVLIYLTPDVIARVVQGFYDALVPGGWLLTGPSDPLLTEFAPLSTVVTDYGVFYRRPLEDMAAVVDIRLEGWATPLPADDQGPPPTPPDAWDAGMDLAETPAPERPTPPLRELPRPAPAVADPLAGPREQFQRGAYGRVAEATAGLEGNPDACALRVRALANLNLAEAVRCCAAAVQRHPLALELHFLHGVLLHETGDAAGAVQALRRALFLDPDLALGHFLLGQVLRTRGEVAGAVRAFRQAAALCAARPADEAVPLSDGEAAGNLAEAARAQAAALEAGRGPVQPPEGKPHG